MKGYRPLTWLFPSTPPKMPKFQPFPTHIQLNMKLTLKKCRMETKFFSSLQFITSFSLTHSLVMCFSFSLKFIHDVRQFVAFIYTYRHTHSHKFLKINDFFPFFPYFSSFCFMFWSASSGSRSQLIKLQMRVWKIYSCTVYNGRRCFKTLQTK